jgi:hypothetical protein
MSYDATSREFCTVRRIRTNTPLQALTTLNDPAFFEAARGLAGRIMVEAGPDARSRATYGYRLCSARLPNSVELQSLVDLFELKLKRFKQDISAASKVSANGHNLSKQREIPALAAWTTVANVLLNMDQTLTKE